jgi:hypothetical protein
MVMRRFWHTGKAGRGFAAVTLLAPVCLFGACGPKSPAEAPLPESEAPEPASSSEEEVAEPSPEPALGEAPPAESKEPEVAPSELVAELCRGICARVKKSCSGRAADFCNASCGDYVDGAETCPTEVHAALTCQTSADDFLLCSNIAAESCAPLYRTMSDCRDGRAAPIPWGQKIETAKKEDVPPGFARLFVKEAAFSILAPGGATVTPGEGGKFKSVSTHDGFEYVVEAVSRDNNKPLDAKTLLRLTTEYVGNACQPKLRLHGRYETQGVVHTRFDTVCADGTEMRGMMHFWEENVVAAFARRSPAALPNQNLEPFIFSFELSAPK